MFCFSLVIFRHFYSDFMTIRAEDGPPITLRDDLPCVACMQDRGKGISGTTHTQYTGRANRLPLVTGEQSSARMS